MLSTWRIRQTLPAQWLWHGMGWRTLLHGASHLLWPWRCPSCGRAGSAEPSQVLCAACLTSVRADLLDSCCEGCGRPMEEPAVEQHRCPACRNRPAALTSVAAVGQYRQTLRQIIVQWKFNRRLGVEPLLTAFMIDALRKQPWVELIDALVPIPSPWVRWVRRGFVWPVADLATGISRRVGKPVWPALRARRHRPQIGLSGTKRVENMKRAFYVPARMDLTGKRICLIDDVMTTGATINAAALASRKAGASQVWALVLAKTPPATNSEAGASHWRQI